MLRLSWPLESDTTSAFFHFETGATLPPEPLKIEVRLYALAGGLPLLDLLELTYRSGKWTKVRQDVGWPAISPLPSRSVIDAMTFHITDEPGGFGMEVFVRDGKEQLVAPLGRAVLLGNLENLLLRVRNHWTQLVIGKMSAKPALKYTYDEELAELAALGGHAWRQLFGDQYAAQPGSREAIGAILLNEPLPACSPVSITPAIGAETFPFPWAILCPPLRRNEKPDPSVIWGLRYIIENTMKPDPEPYSHEVGRRRVRIAAAIDPNFAGSVNHPATLERIAALGPGVELLDNKSEADLLDRLEEVPPADVYYFFCQGISPGRASPLDIDIVAEIQKEIARLPELDRKPWEMLLPRMKSDPGEASLSIGTLPFPNGH
jgi:hypothetical protein